MILWKPFLLLNKSTGVFSATQLNNNDPPGPPEQQPPQINQKRHPPIEQPPSPTPAYPPGLGNGWADPKSIEPCRAPVFQTSSTKCGVPQKFWQNQTVFEDVGSTTWPTAYF